MKSLILMMFVFLISQPGLAVDKKKQSEIASLLQLHLPVETQSITWVKKQKLLLVAGRTQNQIVLATIFDPSSRVLDIQVNGKNFYRWRGIKVVGHRAESLLVPENTIAAIKKAQQLGVHIFELDVRQTKDNHLVIMHDDTVNRTTTGRGKVKDLTLSQLKKFDAGVKFSNAFKGEPIPTLSEALQAVKEGGGALDIDFKEGDIQILKKTLLDANFPLDATFTFYGSNSEFKEVKQWGQVFIRPGSPLGTWTLSSIVKELSPTIINISELQHTQGYLSTLHKKGLKSWVNIILARLFEEKRLRDVVDTLPDYIQTDRPDYLIPYLQSKGLYFQ